MGGGRDASIGLAGVMRALAIDTVSPVPALAVVEAAASGPSRERLRLLPPASAESLVPELTALLSDAGLALADLSRIAVVTGPGSFTGLRAGVAFARGLARARGLALVPVGTFRAAAEAFPRPEEADFLLDAGRGDVHRARRRAGALAEMERPAPRAAAEATARAEGAAVLDLAAAGRALAPAAGRIALAAGPGSGPIAPAYGRRSAAEEKLEGRRP